MDIIYYLHCAWRPQSSGKVERANQFLKSVIKKITQKTSLGWKEALPIALLHTHIAPKEQAGFSPYEMLYGRPFVYVNDLFLDPEVHTPHVYILLELPNGHGLRPEGLSLWIWEEVIDINQRSPIQHLIRTKTNLFLRGNTGVEESCW